MKCVWCGYEKGNGPPDTFEMYLLLEPHPDVGSSHKPVVYDPACNGCTARRVWLKLSGLETVDIGV